jgi:thiol:disulfide interchange protein DsbC
MDEKFPQFSILAIIESEIAGLYELHGKNNIIYTDGKHLVVGHVLTLDGQRDLTQEKIEKLPVEAVSIDTSAALTIGTGAKEVVMITDPECPYCQSAEEWFKNSNTTRKILFLLLDFHPKAAAISEHILCSEKPDEEYQRIMDFISLNGSDKLEGLISCDSGKAQLAEMQKAINELGITGTPTFIVDGKLIEGADPKLLELIK